MSVKVFIVICFYDSQSIFESFCCEDNGSPRALKRFYEFLIDDTFFKNRTNNISYISRLLRNRMLIFVFIVNICVE